MFRDYCIMMMNVNPVDATADEPMDRYIYLGVCKFTGFSGGLGMAP